MGLYTLEDLLLFYPRAYEVHHSASVLAELNLQCINRISAKLCDFSVQTTRNNKSIYRATFQDAQGTPFEAVWFHKPYKIQAIREGSRVVLSGKVKYNFGQFAFQSPELVSAGDAVSNIIPVYRATEKIKSSYLEKKIQGLLSFAHQFSEVLPSELIKEEGLMSRSEAIRIVHEPKTQEELEKARERLAFEELYSIHKKALLQKQEYQNQPSDFENSVEMEPEFIKAFFKTLPFTPTNAQKISLFEILTDFSKNAPMLRLLEGDVGSGKTLVAMTAALVMICQGYQVAIMAPTEILARQHCKSFQEFLSVFYEEKMKKPLQVDLLLGAQKKKEKQEVLLNLLQGNTHIIIGTHALIQENVEFSRLGFVVIDEQHRFGVEQRKILAKKGSPHILSMTATPIPRTLALIAYGDQDLSVINEMPPGRTPIITKCISPRKKPEIIRFIDNQIGQGFQVFTVCPLIEESKSEIMADVRSVTEEFKNLKHLFPNRSIGMLHGKMKADEKNKIMSDFKERKYDILVATSVIEVGIDIPNANIMIIQGAERFGLSQLHQFRGRVGRGSSQSYCFLFSTKQNVQNERLNALEKYTDGFQLSEIDLQLRGPGEVYGVRQSGIPDLKMANLTNPDFVYRVRKAAEKHL